MKRFNLFFTFIILLISASSFAQIHLTQAQLDEVKALKAGRIFVECDKALVEPNEVASLALRLTLYPKVNPETLEQEGLPEDMEFPEANDPVLPSGYKEGTWKIISGGGKLLRNTENKYYYTAPATAPPDKTIVISVELLPKSKGVAKVILLKTLYYVDDPTAIVVDLPEGGFTNQKFIDGPKGGLKMPTMQNVDPRVAGHIDPSLQAKMAQAQAAVAAMQQTNNLNVSALTSNAMAIYDAGTNLTAVTFKGLTMQMSQGKLVKQTTGASNILFQFSFTGKGVGMHPLNDPSAGLGFNVIGSPQGCICGNNKNGETSATPCNGYVNIKSIEKGVMKGTIYTKVYTLIGKKLVKGYIGGKFTAAMAN